jgi:hypothetical protein
VYIARAISDHSPSALSKANKRLVEIIVVESRFNNWRVDPNPDLNLDCPMAVQQGLPNRNGIITQRSAVQIRPHNRERHYRNAVAFALQLPSAPTGACGPVGYE